MTPWCQFIMTSCTASEKNIKKPLMEWLILDNYWVLHYTLFFFIRTYFIRTSELRLDKKKNKLRTK